MLYIVATPIGNLKDITFRAVEVLKSADLIACEDTRHTRILLERYGITTPTTSYFQHNRFSKGDYLIGLLKEGKTVALVSDAGTPGILDPGYNLINAAVEAGIAVQCIPGPAAFVAGLVCSGKPAHEFHFLGFLPAKSRARRNALAKALELGCTVVCYESCHRIRASLEDLAAVCGDREIVVCRELTKKFEEVLRGTPSGIATTFEERVPKGEFVIIL